MKVTSREIDAQSLGEFFREVVHDAITHQNMNPPEAVEFYLVNLLQDCTHSKNIFSDLQESETLVDLYLQAIQSETRGQIQLFKKLGDLALFTAGFFPESFSRKLINAHYYVQMGESAYGYLTRLLARQQAFVEIFGELASRFAIYVDILNEVSEQSRITNDLNLLKQYERWLRTGSQRAAQILIKEGIFPLDTSTQLVQ